MGICTIDSDDDDDDDDMYMYIYIYIYAYLYIYIYIYIYLYLSLGQASPKPEPQARRPALSPQLSPKLPGTSGCGGHNALRALAWSASMESWEVLAWSPISPRNS